MISWILAVCALLLLALLVFLRTSVRSLACRSERIGALLIMGILPGIWLLGTVDHTLKQMTTTEFCIQCHTMEGYGKSLHAEDAESSLAAAHFQNNRVPRHEACYECHADHRPVIGLIKTKLNGLREAYIEYLGTPHEPLKMSKPYENTNCLRCHGKARNFRETHEDDLETILAGKTRCLECHDVGHDLGGDKDE